MFIDKKSMFIDKKSMFIDKKSMFIDKKSMLIEKKSMFIDKKSMFIDKKSMFIDKSLHIIRWASTFWGKNGGLLWSKHCVQQSSTLIWHNVFWVLMSLLRIISLTHHKTPISDQCYFQQKHLVSTVPKYMFIFACISYLYLSQWLHLLVLYLSTCLYLPVFLISI
jgi:hypothetical protein